jgi:hypothetical protein
LKKLEDGGRGLCRELENLVEVLSKLLILRVVSAEGIESALKRIFNDMQVSG